MSYNEEQMLKIKKDLQDEVFGRVRSTYDEYMNYYEQNVAIGNIPPEVEIYKPPTAREDVNAAVSHIMSLGHTCTVPYWSETEEAKKQANILEGFGNAFLQIIDKKFSNLRRNCIKNGILYGAFIRKGPLYIPRIRPEGIADKEWEKTLEGTFPFHFRSVHPKNAVWVDGEIFIEEFTRKAIQVKANWPEWDIGDRDLFDDVKWWEFWTPSQRVYFVDNEIVDNVDNEYGFIPYDVGYGGFGRDSVEGKPEDMIVSMIAPLMSSYRMEYRVKTAVIAGAEYDTYGKRVMNRPKEEGESISSAPGDVDIVNDDANYRIMDAPKVGDGPLKALQIVDQDEQKVVPRIFHGQGQKYESGYGQAQRLMHTSVSLLTGLISEWEKSASDMLDKTIQLVANVVEEPIGILGNFPKEKSMKIIKPTDIKPDVQHFYVTLDAKTPEEKEHRIRLGMDQWVTGSLSLETLHTDYYGIDHITERQRMTIEKLMRHPDVMNIMAQEAVSDVGMRDLLQYANEGAFNESKAPPHGVGTESNQNMRFENPATAMLPQGQ
jgi:hypothetical protein